MSKMTKQQKQFQNELRQWFIDDGIVTKKEALAIKLRNADVTVDSSALSAKQMGAIFTTLRSVCWAAGVPLTFDGQVW